MFSKGDRVRHINEQTNQQYGVMQICEIKNGSAICKYGGFHNFALVTFSLTELKKSAD
jgi:hypothetical protein